VKPAPHAAAGLIQADSTKSEAAEPPFYQFVR